MRNFKNFLQFLFGAVSMGGVWFLSAMKGGDKENISAVMFAIIFSLVVGATIIYIGAHIMMFIIWLAKNWDE